MGKFAAILGLSLAAAAGATYGLYYHTDVFGCKKGCNGGHDDSCCLDDYAGCTQGTSSEAAAVAVAGPVALAAQTTSVSADAHACCADARPVSVAVKTTVKPACCAMCCEEAAPTTAVAAVTGTAVTMK